MRQETKNCQNCKNDFTIEPEDFDFYTKINVPPPTFCPDCRLQRRLAFFNLTKLYKRKCDLCNKDSICMYHPDAPYVVYCPQCWWSDNWSPLDYGREYDFSKPFFEQFNDLLKDVPLLGLSLDLTTTNLSPHNNHAQQLKDSYMVFNGGPAEDSLYCFMLVDSRNIVDSTACMQCENCYDCMHLFKSNRCVGTRGNIKECIDCYFLRDCSNCQNCFGCCNLQNKKYCFFNKQLTKEEYEKRLQEYDFGSYEGYQRAKVDVEKFWLSQPPKPLYNEYSKDTLGNYVFWCNSCKECYDVAQTENSKYIAMVYQGPCNDNYDITNWGQNMELCYEGSVVGNQVRNVLFCQESGIGLYDASYSKLATTCSHVFGSVSVRKIDYTIFNKKYTPEEYAALKEKIIQHMDEMPYTDKQGNVYKYGEFFPAELSPSDYKYSLAASFFPLEDEQIYEKNYTTYSEIESSHKTTIQASDLPDHIQEVDESILDQVIACSKTGKAYKIHPKELQFLKYMNLPLPRVAPLERINERVNLWAKELRLIERESTRSGEKFLTHYTKEEAPEILSPDEYKQEFIA